MELEVADVGPFVFFLLVQTFLELAFFLEAVFLGHLTLLFLRFDDASLFAIYLHLAVEHLVFAELAFQRAVKQRNLDRRLQANLVEAFFPITEHPGVVARKLVFQPLAYHLIGGQQVGCRDAFSIRRIGHHDAGFLRLLEVLEVLLVDGDVAGETSRFDVHAGGIDRFDVHIVTIDVVFELTLLRVVVVDFVKEFRVEVGPLLKCKLLTEQARSHIPRNECSLDEQGAGTAHGVNEISLSLPSRHQNHSCCQYLV